jgi:integrase/recombinase XerD
MSPLQNQTALRRAPSITASHARAQRAKRKGQEQRSASQEKSAAHQERQRAVTIADAIDEYLRDHEGGNHSPKTLEWHATALNLLRHYLEEQRAITLVEEVDAPALSAWFAYMRKTPGAHKKVRSERTIQTYARSARAFFHWLVHRGTLNDNPFDQVVFPKVGRPLIKTIEPEEFERLLNACTPPHESGVLGERAAARNRAILWLFYDTGIRVSELCSLRMGNLDRKRGVLTVQGKGSKERRVALGNTCLRHLLHYLDRHRPEEQELAEWGSAGEDHLFLSETRKPLTKNGVEMLFKRLKARAGLTGKRISPHILRHTFAINYLLKSNDPFSLQELLGHEDLSTVFNYIRMNDAILQDQKRKYSPGDHIPIQEPKKSRRTGFLPKPRSRRSAMQAH